MDLPRYYKTISVRSISLTNFQCIHQSQVVLKRRKTAEEKVCIIIKYLNILVVRKWSKPKAGMQKYDLSSVNVSITEYINLLHKPFTLCTFFPTKFE